LPTKIQAGLHGGGFRQGSWRANLLPSHVGISVPEC